MIETLKPGYKHTSLGWIPEEWEVKEFGEIVTKSQYGVNNPTKIDGNYPIVGMKNIQNGKLILDNLSKITISEAEIEKVQLKKDDFLFNRTNSYELVGKSVLIEKDLEATYASYLVRFRIDNEVAEPHFVVYYFNTDEADKKLKSIATKAVGQANINPTILKKKFLLPLPPLPEQRKIASVLASWDKAIATQNALIAALERRQSALMQKLLAGKVRLKGFAGEWKEVDYRNLLQVVKRPVVWDDSELYRLISVRRRSGGIFARESLYGHQIKVKDLRTAKTGDFLFSKMQILHGASALVGTEFDNSKISGSYIATVAKDDSLLDLNYFSWYSQHPIFYHQTYISSFGVHIEKMTFDFDSFLSLTMHLPSLPEQRAIAQILSTSEAEIAGHRRQLAALKEQKKGLMQVLLSGKKRVTI